MFEKILYPTDFSDVSNKALGFIKQLKGAGTKEVLVLHVIDERETERLRHIPETNAEEIEKIHEESVHKEIKAIADELKKSGLEVKTRIDRGIPFREILKVEKEEGISAVVIGSHGKTCISEMLLGSCSEKVIRKSAKPVLVVRR